MLVRYPPVQAFKNVQPSTEHNHYHLLFRGKLCKRTEEKIYLLMKGESFQLGYQPLIQREIVQKEKDIMYKINLDNIFFLSTSYKEGIFQELYIRINMHIPACTHPFCTSINSHTMGRRYVQTFFLNNNHPKFRCRSVTLARKKVNKFLFLLPMEWWSLL